MIPAGRRMRKVLAALLSITLLMNLFLTGCYDLIPVGKDNHDYKIILSSQDLFNEIYDSLYRFEEDVYVQTDSYDQFMSYWNDLDGQFALHSAFREKDIRISRLEKDNVCKITMHMQLNTCGQAMQYLYAKNVKDYPTKEAKEVGERLLAIKNDLIHENMSDEEKIRTIHDYLIYHCAYALDGDVNYYSSTGVLLNEGQAQCQGYSEAFTALCLLSGVESRVISGSSTFGFGEGAHAWNQVRINYIWYHIDVTWDDPIPDEPGMIRYDFYLKSDSLMKQTHAWCPYFEECFVDYAS